MIVLVTIVSLSLFLIPPHPTCHFHKKWFLLKSSQKRAMVAWILEEMEDPLFSPVCHLLDPFSPRSINRTNLKVLPLWESWDLSLFLWFLLSLFYWTFGTKLYLPVMASQLYTFLTIVSWFFSLISSPLA